MIFQVYELTDPCSGLCRYVGRTTLVAKRYREHINAARRGKRLPVYNWIRSLLDTGARPGLRVLETCDESGVDSREIFWVAQRKSEGCSLTNIHAGGCGPLMVNHSLETRRKISESRKGMKFTPEHIANMSASRIGKTRTPEQRKKISEALTGIVRSTCERAAISERMRGNKHSVGNVQSAEQVEARAAGNRGEKNGMSTLTNDIVREIRDRFVSGQSRIDISKSIGVAQGIVNNVIARRSYSSVE